VSELLSSAVPWRPYHVTTVTAVLPADSKASATGRLACGDREAQHAESAKLYGVELPVCLPAALCVLPLLRHTPLAAPPSQHRTPQSPPHSHPAPCAWPWRPHWKTRCPLHVLLQAPYASHQAAAHQTDIRFLTVIHMRGYPASGLVHAAGLNLYVAHISWNC
jgi:hypothetical protein